MLCFTSCSEFIKGIPNHCQSSYRAISPDVMATMLVHFQQNNFDSFFCLELQHGRNDYCLLFLLGSCENALFEECSVVVKD